MTPRRIRRERTKGWRMPPNTVYVGRPSLFGNPYVGKNAVKQFESYVEGKTDNIITFLFERRFTDKDLEKLKGKNLSCWCPLDKPCHGDILLKIANS